MNEEPDIIPAEVASEPITIFQILIMVLSVYVLIALAVQATVQLTPEMDELLNNIDAAICFVFLGDFFHRFYRAPSKWKFMRWGWIDLLSSIPFLTTVRSGKMLRVIKIFRILRAFRSVRTLFRYLMRNRTPNTFVTVAGISVMLVIGGSMAILNLEEMSPDRNIKSPSDALWWSIVTITTVGYGDRYPVTDAGRALAAFMMIAGVGLFGTFTGFVASMFVEPDIKREENEVQILAKQIKALRSEIRTLDHKITRQNKKQDEERKRRRQKKAKSAAPQTPPPSGPDSGA